MASDMFFKLDGAIKGESTDSKHKDEIEVLSWSWGESNEATAASGGGRGAGKVSMQDFVIVKQTDKASPLLALACATGEHIKEATLTVRRAGGEQQEYLEIKLSECLVSSYQVGGSNGAGVPEETCTFNYTKIEWQYKPQKPDGTLDSPVKAGYNLAENKKV